MITINCSLAAAEHLYKGFKKGRDEGFFVPTNGESLEDTQREQEKNQQLCLQWVVHAIKLGRSVSLIAMEYQTRYCHVIHQVKKGDVQGFFGRLQERLMNGLQWQGVDYSLFGEAELDKGFDRYFSAHKDIQFMLRSDKSVMAHIAQVNALYSDVYYDNSCYPPNEESALEYDLRLNQDWRNRKGEPYHLQAYEKMLRLWLKDYLQFPPEKLNSQWTE